MLYSRKSVLVQPANTATNMPPHPQQVLDWQQNTSLVGAPHLGAATSFTYIFPVPKWHVAQRVTMAGNYKGGEAYSIGNQPYDQRELWMARRTPRQPSLRTNMQAYPGVQGSGTVLASQKLLAQLLNGSNANGG